MDAPRLLVVGLLALGVGLWASLGPAAPAPPLTGAFLPLAAAAETDTYLRATVDSFAEPGQRVFVTGSLASAGSALNETVNLWLSNATNASITTNATASAAGAFNLSLTLPAIPGNFTLTVNSTSLDNHTFNLTTSWFQRATMGFLDRLPPFLPGDSFRINTTAQFSNATTLSSQPVRVTIYAANGVPQSWALNKDNTTNSAGWATHSFTVPADAGSGDYIARAGPGSLVFTIKNHTVSVSTLATNGDGKTFFATTDTVVVQAKVSSNGTAIAASSVTATVRDPSGAVAGTLTLTGSNGVYNSSFTNLTAGEGLYSVTVNATVNGVSTFASGSFQVRSARITVSESSFGNFFDQWGSKKVVSPGSNISLDIKAFDVSTGAFIKGSLSPGAEKAMNCSNISIISVKFSNGTDITNEVAIRNRVASQKFSGDALCTVVVNTTLIPGTFSIKLNVSVNATTAYAYENATGFFSTSNYLLRVSAVGKIGKDEGFAIAKPGSNATFKLEARNVSSGSTLGKGNISSVAVSSITPVGEFGGSSAAAVTGVSSWFDPVKDKLTVEVPTTVNGPALVSVQGQVGGETVSGSGFFIANYLMGFAGPVGGGALGGGEVGGGPSGDFGGTIASCSASKPQEFFAFVMDSESAQAKSSVTLSLNTVREERTGANVTSCFSTSGGITDSTGRAQFNLSVVNSSCANSLSGGYFMLFDAAWQNLTDQIPGGFQCKRLNFWPYTSTWQLGKNGSVNLTLSNIAYAGNSSKRVTNGTANITRLVSFDPAKGATNILVDRFAGISFNSTPAYMVFSPINSSTLDSNNVSWLNGFYDATVRVCDNLNTSDTSDDVCDTSQTGWSVQPFQAFVSDNTVWSRNWTVNETLGIGLWSERNITSVNVTRVNFRSQERTVLLNSNCINNSATSCWSRNNSAFSFGVPPGGHLVTVNFTIPATVEPGQGMIEIVLNDNLTSDSVTTSVFANLKGLVQSIVVPGEIWPMDMRWAGSSYFPFSAIGPQNEATNATLVANLGDIGPGELRWNLTWLNQTHNARSRFEYINMSNVPLQGYCSFTNLFNKSGACTAFGECGASGQNAMIGFANDTAGPNGDTLFFKNYSSVAFDSNGNFTAGPIKERQSLSVINKPWLYLKKFEFCIPVFVSSNASEYSIGCGPLNASHPVCDQQGWQTDFAFAGRFQTSSNATIPFVASKSNSTGSYGMSGATVNITEIAILEKDKIAFSGVLPTSSFRSQAATADSRGMAFVTLNITRPGTYRLFWSATVNGQEESADFENAPVIEVSSFNAFGRWQNNQPTQSVTNGSYHNFTGTIQAQYFNGTNIPNATVSLNYMDFSSFGPPTISSVLVSNSTTRARISNLTTGTDGSVSFDVTAANGWPTSRRGTCVNVQGVVNATAIDAALGTTEIFLGTVCTSPT